MAKKLLVVYYSISNGNTKRIAEQLRQATGADLVQIDTAVPYIGSYEEIVEQGRQEVDREEQPELKPLDVNPEDYDVIVVGTPTWWYTMAPAVRTFLESHRWKGKTVIPFQTHGGWPGHAVEDMKKACAGAAFAYEMSVQFDSTGGDKLVTPEAELDVWIIQIKAGGFRA